MSVALARLRVVLVRPHYAGNVGAVARAMANFGHTDLVLVDPIADPQSHQARWMATKGQPILEHARVVPDLISAVADCQRVVGTSAATQGTLRETIRGTPDEILPTFAASLEHGPSAIVFGPEPHGLATEELAQCHALLHLPTDPMYSSLNLSLSVGIVLYELRKTYFRLHENPQTKVQREPHAVYADFDRVLKHLEQAFTAVGFTHGAKAESLMQAFRHLVAKAQPTPQEIKLLHGLARQLLYVSGKSTAPERS
jgi:TrmH family RNA methyltransferase